MESMKNYPSGQRSVKLEEQSASETEGHSQYMKQFAQECADFREVFGAKGHRTAAQQRVVDWLNFSCHLTRPINGPGIDTNAIVGRSGLHDLGLEIMKRADSEFQGPKQKEVKVDRSSSR